MPTARCPALRRTCAVAPPMIRVRGGGRAARVAPEPPPKPHPSRAGGVKKRRANEATGPSEVPPAEVIVPPAQLPPAEIPDVSPRDSTSSALDDSLLLLSSLDDRLVGALEANAIRLVRIAWFLDQPEGDRLRTRQELEQIESSGASPSPLLSSKEAVALVRRGKRGAGVLSYGWLCPGSPDPDCARTRVVQSALKAHSHIEGLFWDYMCALPRPCSHARARAKPNRAPCHVCHRCLFQGERTSEQRQAFSFALSVMGDLYASAVGTTVLQLKEIPKRPQMYDGAIALLGVAADVINEPRRLESDIRTAFNSKGTIVKIEIKSNGSPVVVQFATHNEALAVIKAGAISGLCNGICMLYNERSYDGREDEKDGREDDTGRGWCCFESAVSFEAVVRLQAYPKMQDTLAALPPKVLALTSEGAATPIEIKQSDGQHVKQAAARIEAASFTGQGDKPKVLALYRDYAIRIVQC